MHEHQLDEKTLRFLERNIAQIKSLQDGLQGALQLLIEQNGLEGRWELDMANKRLVRIDGPPQQVKAVA